MWVLSFLFLWISLIQTQGPLHYFWKLNEKFDRNHDEDISLFFITTTDCLSFADLGGYHFKANNDHTVTLYDGGGCTMVNETFFNTGFVKVPEQEVFSVYTQIMQDEKDDYLVLEEYGKIRRIGKYDLCVEFDDNPKPMKDDGYDMIVGLSLYDGLSVGDLLAIYPTLRYNMIVGELDVFFEIDIVSSLYFACFKYNTHDEQSCIDRAENCEFTNPDPDDVKKRNSYHLYDYSYRGNELSLTRVLFVGNERNYYIPYVIYWLLFTILLAVICACLSGLVFLCPWSIYEPCVGCPGVSCLCIEYFFIGKGEIFRESKVNLLRCCGITNKAICSSCIGTLFLVLACVWTLISFVVDMTMWFGSVTFIALMVVSNIDGVKRSGYMTGTYFLPILFVFLLFSVALRMVIQPIQTMVFNTNPFCDCFYHYRSILHDTAIFLLPLMPIFADINFNATMITLLAITILRIDVLFYTYFFCFCTPESPVLDLNICCCHENVNQCSRCVLEGICLPFRKVKVDYDEDEKKERRRKDIEMKDRTQDGGGTLEGKDDGGLGSVGGTRVGILDFAEDSLVSPESKESDISSSDVDSPLSGLIVPNHELVNQTTGNEKGSEKGESASVADSVIQKQAAEEKENLEKKKGEETVNQQVPLVLSEKNVISSPIESGVGEKGKKRVLFQKKEEEETETLFPEKQKEDDDGEENNLMNMILSAGVKRKSLKISMKTGKQILKDLRSDFSVEDIMGLDSLLDFEVSSSDDEKKEKKNFVGEEQPLLSIEELMEETESIISEDDELEVLSQLDSDLEDMLEDSSSSSSSSPSKDELEEGGGDKEGDGSTTSSDDIDSIADATLPSSLAATSVSSSLGSALTPSFNENRMFDDDDDDDYKKKKHNCEEFAFLCCDVCEPCVPNLWKCCSCMVFCNCISIRMCDIVIIITSLVVSMVCISLSYNEVGGDSDTRNNVLILVGITHSALFAATMINSCLFWNECCYGKVLGKANYLIHCVPMMILYMLFSAALVILRFVLSGIVSGNNGFLEGGIESLRDPNDLFGEYWKMYSFLMTSGLYTIVFFALGIPAAFCLLCCLGRTGKWTCEGLACFPFLRKTPLVGRCAEIPVKCANNACKVI